MTHIKKQLIVTTSWLAEWVQNCNFFSFFFFYNLCITKRLLNLKMSRNNESESSHLYMVTLSKVNRDGNLAEPAFLIESSWQPKSTDRGDLKMYLCYGFTTLSHIIFAVLKLFSFLHFFRGNEVSRHYLTTVSMELTRAPSGFINPAFKEPSCQKALIAWN